jgi:hypothetical protein
VSPWKVSSDAKNLVLQTMLFQKVGVCRKLPGWAGIIHCQPNSSFLEECQQNCIMSDFRHSPRCKWDIICAGMLRGIDWWLLTEVLGQRIGALKMGPVGCPETSVTNYRCKKRNIPEEKKSENVTE